MRRHAARRRSREIDESDIQGQRPRYPWEKQHLQKSIDRQGNEWIGLRSSPPRVYSMSEYGGWLRWEEFYAAYDGNASVSGRTDYIGSFIGSGEIHSRAKRILPEEPSVKRIQKALQRIFGERQKI